MGTKAKKEVWESKPNPIYLRFRAAQDTMNKHLLTEIEKAIKKRDWDKAISLFIDLHNVNSQIRESRGL